MADGNTKPYSSRDKWMVSLIASLLFFLFASPFLFNLLNSGTSSFGLETASPTGCPTLAGLILMTVFFLLVVRLLMM